MNAEPIVLKNKRALIKRGQQNIRISINLASQILHLYYKPELSFKSNSAYHFGIYFLRSPILPTRCIFFQAMLIGMAVPLAINQNFLANTVRLLTIFAICKSIFGSDGWENLFLCQDQEKETYFICTCVSVFEARIFSREEKQWCSNWVIKCFLKHTVEIMNDS